MPWPRAMEQSSVNVAVSKLTLRRFGSCFPRGRAMMKLDVICTTLHQPSRWVNGNWWFGGRYALSGNYIRRRWANSDRPWRSRASR